MRVWPVLFAEGGDLEHYLVSGRAVLAGHSPYLHDFANQTPLLVLAVAPLAALPLPWARLVWFAVGQAAVLTGAWALWRRLGGGRERGLAVAGALALGGTLDANLALGQVQALLFGLLLLALFVERRRPAAAGLLVGVAAGLKLWPALLLAGWAWRGRWRALAWGVGGTAASLALPTLLLAALTAPPHATRQAGYWLGSPATLNFSLPATALRWASRPAGGPPPASWVAGNNPGRLTLAPAEAALSAAAAALTLGLGLAALARLAARRPRPFAGHPDPAPREQAALLVLATVAAPIAWYHAQLFALPALSLLAAEALADRRPGRLGAVLLLGLAAGYPHELAGRAATAAAAAAWGALPSLADLVLFAWLTRGLARSGRNQEGAGAASPSR